MPNPPLVLVLDAQTNKLKSALKDAGTSLADYGKSAAQMMQEVQEGMQTALGNGAEDMAKRMTKALQQQITLSKRLAQSALDQGQNYNPLGEMNSAGSIAAAEAQERLAKSYRDQAAAAAVATSEDENVALGLRQVAVASELSAQEADRQAMALRKQAQVFAAIEAEMGVAADEGATRVVGSHNRMNVSSMLLMHSVRSAGDSFAAGLPLATIFAEQIGRVGEAAELTAMQTRAAGGAAAESTGLFASFGSVMAGPWGLAVMGGVTILGLLIKELTETSNETEHATSAHETLAEKLNLEKHAYDEVIASMREYNHEKQIETQTALLAAQQAQRDAANILKKAADNRLAAQQALDAANYTISHTATKGGAGMVSAEVGELKKKLDDADKALKAAQEGERNTRFDVASEKAKLVLDPKHAIEEKYKGLELQAKLKITNEDQLKVRLIELGNQQKAEEDALKPAKAARTPRAKRAPVDRTPARDSSYDTEYDRLTQELDKAKLGDATDPAELARLKKQELDDANQKAKDAILAKARRDDWSKADTDALLLKQDEVNTAAKAAIDAKAKADAAKKEQETQIKNLEAADTLLQLQEQLAPTLRARIAIQQQILANEKQIALLKANGDPAQVAQVNQQYAAKTQIQNKANADPVTKYLDQIQQQSGDTNAALKGVEADGLKSLTDGLTGVVSGTESVSGAFKKMANSIIADLARIAIEKLIAGLFGQALGGGGNTFGGGADTSGFSAVSAGGVGFADGGPVFGPGGPKEDKIPAMLSAGEFVVNAAATRKHAALLHAINENHVPRFADGGIVGQDISFPRLPSAASLRTGGGNAAPVTFDLRGAVMTEDLLNQMNQISARHSASVLMAAPDLTQRNLADAQRMRIPS